MQNNIFPHATHQHILKSFLLIFSLLLVTEVASAEDAEPAVEQSQAEVTAESDLIEQTNAYRARYNLEPLAGNEKLNEACQKFAEVMARTGRMSHYADGRSPSSRVSAAGYTWSSVAENIAYRWDRKSSTNKNYAKATLNQWINSSGHRRNLLSSQNTQCGVAFATNPQSGKTFAVMLYARPGN